MLTYSDLVELQHFEDRLDYLRVDGLPAEQTFGVLRHMNQTFYASRAWKLVREAVIARDFGCDLGIPGRDIFGRVIVHHMNPLAPRDLYHSSARALDPEFLITVSHETHLSIHFGYDPTPYSDVDRCVGDTKLW